MDAGPELLYSIQLPSVHYSMHASRCIALIAGIGYGTVRQGRKGGAFLMLNLPLIPRTCTLVQCIRTKSVVDVFWSGLLLA